MTPMHIEPEPMDRLLPGDGGLAPPSASRPATAGNGTQALFRLDLLRSLQLHRNLALGIAIAGIVLAVAYWFYVGPVYQAESIVYIQPSPPRVMPQGPSWPYSQRWPYDSNTYESYITQQMQNVTRADVLAGAVRKLQSGNWLQSGESDQAAADRLKSSVKVTRQGTSYQFAIDAHSNDGQAASDAANAVAASFIESASHEQKAGDKQRLAVLGEERDRVQKALAADRTEQEALNKQMGVASIGTAAPDVYDEDIGRIRGELVTARTAHDQAAARLISMDANHGSSSALDATADELVANDSGLMSMKTSLNQRRAALISQMANLKPNHPQYKQDAAELTQINGNLDAMMTDLRAKAADRIQMKLRSDLEQTAGVEGRLNAQLKQLTGAAGGATSKMQRANDLAIDINRLQNRFTTVDEEWRNLTLEENAPGSAFLSAAATPPTHPVLVGKLRNAGLLVFAGLFFGMLAAVIAHKMDPRIYIASDVERVLGYTPMAQLPDFYEVPAGVSEEHMLRLAASIEHARELGNLKSCIFTGTGPGTGVTTVAGKVRDLLEAMGRPTVLVDATGTTTTVEPAGTAKNGLSGVQALVASQRGSRPTALLQQMADKSKTQGESLVLTDSAPLVLSAETEYLARFVDCAIVVVQSGVTTRTQLRDTATTLQRLDVGAVGFVLNRVGLEKADPAFRLSVKAIEEHLDTQSSSMARREARNRALTEEAAPKNEIYSREAAALPQYAAVVPESAPVPAARLAPPAVPQAAVLAQYDPVVPEYLPVPAARLAAPAVPQAPALAQFTAVVPEPVAVAEVRLAPPPVAKVAAPILSPAVPQAAAPRPTPAVPDLTKLPAQNPQRELWQPRAQEALQPMTIQNSNLPWWLADLYPQPEESNPFAHREPATARGAQAVAAELRPAGVTPMPRPTPAPVQSWERLAQVPAAATAVSPNGWKPVVSTSAAAVSPAAYKPIVPTDRSSSVVWKPAAVPEEILEAGPEENASGLATRLSGLRSLLSVLGVKDLPPAAEPAVKETEGAQPVDPAIDRAAYASTIALTPALATPTGSAAINASPRLVTAAPEFLPPRPVVEEAENSQPSRFRNRRDRQDDFDDVQILPSWRGQYRK
jgi:uncharacterized protein involved in exopolysaccharide biosynthesis/Mrp family chromosome partitioning ATPase